MKHINLLSKNMEKETLNQSEWTEFWKKMRDHKSQAPSVECYINGKARKFTDAEFEVAKQILWTPQILSKCCNAGINDNKCEDCGEVCEIVYVF